MYILAKCQKKMYCKIVIGITSTLCLLSYCIVLLDVIAQFIPVTQLSGLWMTVISTQLPQREKHS